METTIYRIQAHKGGLTMTVSDAGPPLKSVPLRYVELEVEDVVGLRLGPKHLYGGELFLDQKEPDTDDLPTLWRYAVAHGLDTNKYIGRRLGLNPTLVAQRVHRDRERGRIPIDAIGQRRYGGKP